MAGKAVIFCAPSGSGKTSLVKGLLARNTNLAFSVSATTRTPRQQEVHGRDYYFISTDDFQSKVNAGDFIEWEEVYAGLRYGTLSSEIERIWSEGKDVIFDIDVQGGLNLKKYFGHKALAIFVAVPSLEVLKTRLARRGTESDESFQKRIDKAAYEAGFSDRFDRVIVNDDFDRALNEAEEAYLAFSKG